MDKSSYMLETSTKLWLRFKSKCAGNGRTMGEVLGLLIAYYSFDLFPGVIGAWTTSKPEYPCIFLTKNSFNDIEGVYEICRSSKGKFDVIDIVKRTNLGDLKDFFAIEYLIIDETK